MLYTEEILPISKICSRFVYAAVFNKLCVVHGGVKKQVNNYEKRLKVDNLREKRVSLDEA